MQTEKIKKKSRKTTVINNRNLFFNPSNISVVTSFQSLSSAFLWIIHSFKEKVLSVNEILSFGYYAFVLAL